MTPMFRSLGRRNYRLWAGGQLVSLTGTWMQNVAQDWLVLQLTGSGVALGLMMGLQFAPLLLFSLWGGVIADRLPKRRILIATQAFMGLLALTLGVLVATGLVEVWMVYILGFLLGCATAIDVPARQSFVGELVGTEDLSNAVSLNSATFNAARVIGPAIAGVLISTVSTSLVFFINSASYAAALTGLLRMRTDELKTSPAVVAARGQLREGLRYVAARRQLLVPIVLVGVIGMFGFNFQITLALMARDEFHRGADTYGLLSSFLAAGCLVGALLTARRSGPRVRVLLGSAVTFGALTFVSGLMPTLPIFALSLLPTGVAMMTFAITANSTAQLGSSERMRGRVMALYSLVFFGGTPIGAPMMGWVAEHFGPRATLLIGGGVCTTIALIVCLLVARHEGHTLDTYRPRLRRRILPAPYDALR